MDILSFISGFFAFPFAAMALFGVFVWLANRHDKRVMHGLAQVETEQHDSEPQPGTMQQPNYSAIALLDQMDALLASRATEAQLDADIEEMQKRGW